jgi:ferrous iron transport protein A
VHRGGIMMMSDLCEGQRARILAIEGGKGFRQKLFLRGISEGSLVKVLSNSQGPVLLEVNRSTIALGAGMAAKIRVRSLDD